MTVARDQHGETRRTKAYDLGAASILWLAYSLFQLSEQGVGLTATVVQVSGMTIFFLGLAIGVRWWRIRNSELSTTSSN